MKKGGYQIVDLKNTPLVSGGVKIEGVYETIEGNLYKPLLLSGIVINDIERADVFVQAVNSGSDYTMSVYKGNITVTSEDMVSFMENA